MGSVRKKAHSPIVIAILLIASCVRRVLLCFETRLRIALHSQSLLNLLRNIVVFFVLVVVLVLLLVRLVVFVACLLLLDR